ncbi:hypothetical protein K501DRAFT_312354 [Backusella circina FSU 941]|nr:hypothetical protein K501DRAFT_312354 [Backusella circina FSU 941]
MYFIGTKSLLALTIIFVNIDGIITAPITSAHTENRQHLLPRTFQGYQYQYCNSLSSYQQGTNVQGYPPCSNYNPPSAFPAMPNAPLPAIPNLPVSPSTLPVTLPGELPALPNLSNLNLPSLSFAD